nr:MAG TPA: portal protein [Caudoviricetes sp.]
MKDNTINATVKRKLNELGYTYINDVPYGYIQMCDNWYSNEPISGFHDRKTIQGEKYSLNRLNFAKRLCSDEANLCEVIEINAGKNNNQFEDVKKIFERNRFDTMYRQQLERMTANGTVGAYIRVAGAEEYDDGSLRGGDIKINYVNANGIVPLTIDNGEVVECAFYGESIRATQKMITLVVFTFDGADYSVSTYEFDTNGNQTAAVENIRLGNVRPFALMENAEVNNLEHMEGFGLPKLLNAIPYLKVLDLCFNLLFSDVDKGEKIIMVNEMLCEIDGTGKPILTPEQKKLFVLMGEKLPEQKEVYHEYNPEIRVEAITKAFELVLSLLSMSFGFGTKKYTFENGKITTATEYAGTKQDQLQELNKQRQQAIEYITGLARAVMWFSNTFSGTSYDINTEIKIDFNDSYIRDEEAELEDMRNDALQFGIPKLTQWYLAKKYNLSDEEAEALIAADEEKEADEGEDGEE